MKREQIVRCCLAALLLQSISAAQDAGFTVLSDWKSHNDHWVERQEGGYMIYRRLNERAFELLDARDREAGAIQSAAGWEARRARVRKVLDAVLGPWPEKTPLNPRAMGVLERDGYRIEKLVFESQPGFHVTAALYVPGKLSGRAPGILYIPGHSETGFRAPHYQNACINLVKKGFVVLAYDPIGQAERHQELDPESGKPIVTTKMVAHYMRHSYPGNQCFLAGVSLTRYFIWDAIRGIDYLVSRPEVDGARIGVTGHSGGGTMTAYTSAIDDRVTVAIPSGFITSYRRMLAINGVQDAEQNILHGLVHGIEHADWLLARAPKPTLLLTTTRDFFPIQGARETGALMRRIYETLRAPANFDRAEDDHGHGYTRKNSEASYAFFMKHLAVPGDAGELQSQPLTGTELRVTRTGQVATEFKGETVFSLNRKESAALLERLERSRKGADHVGRVVARARELSGYRSPQRKDDAVYRGGFPRQGYRIEKHTLDGGPNAVIPMLLALPEGEGPRPAVIYLHPEGKKAAIVAGGLVETLAREGYVVLVPDVIGTGETSPRISRTNDHNAPFYLGALVRGSVVGLQAEDVSRVVAWLSTHSRVRPGAIGLAATGHMGPAAIHAAAFNKEISWLVLERAPAAYSEVVLNRFYTTPTSAMVPAALTAYDLPDLLASLAPRRVAVLAPVDQRDEPLTAEAAGRIFRYPTARFEKSGAKGRLRIVAEPAATMTGTLRDMLAGSR